MIPINKVELFNIEMPDNNEQGGQFSLLTIWCDKYIRKMAVYEDGDDQWGRELCGKICFG
jgi:hypothetical protein